MTRVLLVVITLICFVSTAAMAAGRLELTGDAQGSSCSIMDDAPGIVEVHMWIYEVQGLSAVQFAAPTPECWAGATWLGDEVPEPAIFIGDTHDPQLGLSIAALQCADGPVYLGYMSFQTAGQGTPCCDYPIIKATGDLYPEINGPLVVLCSDPYNVAGITVSGVVNPDANCPSCLQAVPAESSTWGQVKALYK